MSSLYNLEPQPTASCILHTTSGDISLELWAQQIPLSCRNFLQHCLDGYYDNTIFHRLVSGFIFQGGDPTGTGSGGESIYDGGAFSEAREEGGIWPMDDRKGMNAGMRGVGFKDEFHSRIKFNRRGLLGMANEGPDSNGSQFFITLGETPELNGRNTCFGRVATEGNTIYNVAKMGEAEVGEGGDRPVYPTKVTSVEVLVNPFRDMIVRERVAPFVVQNTKVPEKKKKRKGGKQLLSFGDEDGDGDAEVEPLPKKAKFDTRIVMDDGDAAAEAKAKPKSKAVKSESKRIVKKPISLESSPEPSSAPPAKPTSIPTGAKPAQTPSLSPSPEPVKKVSTLLDRTNAQIAELKASMKRNIPKAAAEETKKKSALEQMIPATSVRGRKRGKAGKAQSDRAALDILKSFRDKLGQAPAEKEVGGDRGGEESVGANGAEEGRTGGAEGEREENEEDAPTCDLHFIANCQSCKKWEGVDEGGNGLSESEDIGGGKAWMNHKLIFEKDKLGKDLNFRKKAEDELVVIDPREKEKGFKEDRKRRRDIEREKGGDRKWDQRRNAELARGSALAGRGAK